MKEKKIKKIIIKIIILVVFFITIWSINHYIQTVALPDQISEIATKQVEDSNEVSRQMRTYQIWQNNIDPITWIITVLFFIILFFKDILNLFGNFNTEEVFDPKK